MEGARQAITWHMGHWVTPLEVIHDEGTEFANTGIREFANTGNGPTVRPQTVRPSDRKRSDRNRSARNRSDHSHLMKKILRFQYLKLDHKY